jgi:hypothetical protein
VKADDDIAAWQRSMQSAGAVIGAILCGLFLLMMTLVVGCSSPSQKILRSLNDYEFHSARYADACPAPPSDPCKAKAVVLRKWSGALDEASAALKRGGAFPLQTKRLGEVEKEMPK